MERRGVVSEVEERWRWGTKHYSGRAIMLWKLRYRVLKNSYQYILYATDWNLCALFWGLWREWQHGEVEWFCWQEAGALFLPQGQHARLHRRGLRPAGQLWAFHRVGIRGSVWAAGGQRRKYICVTVATTNIFKATIGEAVQFRLLSLLCLESFFVGSSHLFFLCTPSVIRNSQWHCRRILQCWR